MKEVRTRFAPSPTGYMHIGGVRTALFSYLIAKQQAGKFVLRIEDTDQARYVEGAINVIYDTLKDLGLNWDEGPDCGGPYAPYIQSERKQNYLMYAEQLIEKGDAYYCFCSEECLEQDKVKAKQAKIPYKYDRTCRELTKTEIKKRLGAKEKYVIRFKMPQTGETIFNDQVYGQIKVNNNELEDLIMIKGDGMPTYNFANIVDDHEMAITHIVRGNEYVASTPKYVLIYQALGWEIPEFIHLPIIKKDKDSDKKLSKRDGAATVASLKRRGYLNAAIINMLALTGWSPEQEKEIYSLEELINEFKIERIGKGNAIFDLAKLNWFNNYYLRQLSITQLLDFVQPYLEARYDLTNKSKSWLKTLVGLYQEQLTYGAEIIELVEIFFQTELQLSIEAKTLVISPDAIQVLSAFKTELITIAKWHPNNIKQALENTKIKTGFKGKMLYMPIRVKLTGVTHGLELPQAIYLLGREIVLKRLTD